MLSRVLSLGFSSAFGAGIADARSGPYKVGCSFGSRVTARLNRLGCLGCFRHTPLPIRYPAESLQGTGEEKQGKSDRVWLCEVCTECVCGASKPEVCVVGTVTSVRGISTTCLTRRVSFVI